MNNVTVIEYVTANWGWALGLAGALGGLTSIASLLNKDRRADIALWLMGAQTETRWNDSFTALFDAVFGRDHLSLRCFIRSTLATLISVTLIWLLMGSAETIGLRIRSDLSLGSVLVIGLCVNVLADYLSLLETRWLLGNMPRHWLAQAGVLLLDLLITTAIIWLAIFAYLRSPLYDGEVETFAEILGVFSVFSVFFYSTFLTSVWTWAYIATTWLMRLARALRLADWLDVEGKPIKVLFLLLSTTLTAVTFIGALATSAVFARSNDGTSLADRTLCALFEGPVCMHVAGLTSSDTALLQLSERACKGGDMAGCSNLGTFFDRGLWTARDEEKAKEPYIESCQAGDAIGCVNLGGHLIANASSKGDATIAEYYFRHACELDEGSGCSNLGYLYSNGFILKQDYSEALFYFGLGCRLEDALGCYNLGVHLEEGLGATQTLPGALLYYQRSCDGGFEPGCKLVKELAQRIPAE